MRTARHLFPSVRLLCNMHCPFPNPSSAYLRVHPKLIHQSCILTAPIAKRPASPFARFVKEMYHETSQLEEKAKTPRVMEMLANKWKTMTDEEKERYKLDYLEDRKEWLRIYEDSTDEERLAFKQKKKFENANKENNLNKKSNKLNASLITRIDSRTVFNYERYGSIRRQFPAFCHEETLKLLLYEWKNLDPDRRGRYVKISAAMRAKATHSSVVYTFMQLYDECYIPLSGGNIYF